LRTLFHNGKTFFWSGILFTAMLGAGTAVMMEPSLRSRIIGDRLGYQMAFLVLAAIFLDFWIRRGRAGGARTPKDRFAIADLAVACAIACFVWYFVDVVIFAERFTGEVRTAAELVKYWPLDGPYASLAFNVPGPRGVIFMEPFACAVALLPAMCLTPLIVRQYKKVVMDWFVFIICLPFVLLAVALGTFPIAILNTMLADWSRNLVAMGNRVPAMLVLAAICYVQVALTGAIIGVCHRRIFDSR
jgi:hypothetical protein